MKTTDKKAFFFDYDGTLWFGSYGQKTLKALKTLKEKGHLVLYNSGRSKANTRFDKIGEIDFDGFLFGGCHLELFGKTLFRSDLTPEQISVALAVEEDFNLRVIYEGVEGVYKKLRYGGDSVGILFDFGCRAVRENVQSGTAVERFLACAGGRYCRTG